MRTPSVKFWCWHWLWIRFWGQWFWRLFRGGGGGDEDPQQQQQASPEVETQAATSGRLPNWGPPQGRNTNICPSVSPAKGVKKSAAPHINKDSSPPCVLMFVFHRNFSSADGTDQHVHSVEQKSIGVIFRTSRSGIDVQYSCHHNSSHFSFPLLVHSWCFSVFHSLQSITPHIY